MTMLPFSAGGQLGDIALVVSKFKDHGRRRKSSRVA
jgi:hypothetical protein